MRYAAATTAAVGLTAFLVVDADNFDFTILQPAWAHVLMFTAIVAGAGTLTAWLDGHLVARWRHSRSFTPVAVVVLFLGVSTLPASVGSLFIADLCFCTTPARPMGVLLVATLLTTTVTWVMRWMGAAPGRRFVSAGRISAIATVALGLIHLGGQIRAIVGS